MEKRPPAMVGLWTGSVGSSGLWAGRSRCQVKMRFQLKPPTEARPRWGSRNWYLIRNNSVTTRQTNTFLASRTLAFSVFMRIAADISCTLASFEVLSMQAIFDTVRKSQTWTTLTTVGLFVITKCRYFFIDLKVSGLMALITGQTTLLGSSAIRWRSGRSQPSVTSQWESRKVRTSPEASSAPSKRPLYSGQIWVLASYHDWLTFHCQQLHGG